MLIDSNDIIDITDDDIAVNVAPADQPASSLRLRWKGKESTTLWVVSWSNYVKTSLWN
jgi:hypothetical protein